MVAIKVLDSKSTQGLKEFFREIEVLYDIRHPNLVKLVGACFEVRALLYEYLPNGSLEDCLKEDPRILTWQMRTRIIYEICMAVVYLHSKSVIHGDLKPANVLLDANFRSKLADFGLSRFLPEDVTTTPFLETTPIGTLGYIDPWFLERCILRHGSDLYSLGVTVLKLLTGQQPTGLAWKIRQADENSLQKMIDPTVSDWPFGLIKEMVYWSLQCCFHNEDSQKLLRDMSTRLRGMLAEIEALEDGRFKPRQDTQCGLRGLEPDSHNKNNKEIMGAANHPSSSSSFLELLQPTQDGLEEFQPKFSLYHHSEISAASNGLCSSLRMGGGDKGYAYKAKLGGTMVAIKLLDSKNGQNQKQFSRKLDILCQLRHHDLVNLRGACFELPSLIYEFIPNGSLADCLRNNPTLLTWQIRTRIIYNICSVLKFLHSRSVVHGDLNSSNILLDAEFNGKLNNFGIYRPLSQGTASRDPYYRFRERYTFRPRPDLYSFGLMILELLTGKETYSGLVRWVAHVDVIEFWLRRVLDPTAGTWKFEMAKELRYWGLECCRNNEKSSQILNDMWIGLDKMLAEID